MSIRLSDGRLPFRYKGPTFNVLVHLARVPAGERVDTDTLDCVGGTKHGRAQALRSGWVTCEGRRLYAITPRGREVFVAFMLEIAKAREGRCRKVVPRTGPSAWAVASSEVLPMKGWTRVLDAVEARGFRRDAARQALLRAQRRGDLRIDANGVLRAA